LAVSQLTGDLSLFVGLLVLTPGCIIVIFIGELYKIEFLGYRRFDAISGWSYEFIVLGIVITCLCSLC
jgi:hypothetical protein